MYILPGSEIIKLPETPPDELAVFVKPYACAVGCVDRYRREHDCIFGDAFGINGTVVLYGAGAIGTLTVAGLYLAGAIKLDFTNQ